MYLYVYDYHSITNWYRIITYNYAVKLLVSRKTAQKNYLCSCFEKYGRIFHEISNGCD